jgi:hypothetical protein
LIVLVEEWDFIIEDLNREGDIVFLKYLRAVAEYIRSLDPN